MAKRDGKIGGATASMLGIKAQLVGKLEAATIRLRDAELAAQAKMKEHEAFANAELEPVRAAYRDALNAFNAHVAPVKQ